MWRARTRFTVLFGPFQVVLGGKLRDRADEEGINAFSIKHVCLLLMRSVKSRCCHPRVIHSLLCGGLKMSDQGTLFGMLAVKYPQPILTKCLILPFEPPGCTTARMYSRHCTSEIEGRLRVLRPSAGTDRVSCRSDDYHVYMEKSGRSSVILRSSRSSTWNTWTWLCWSHTISPRAAALT